MAGQERPFSEPEKIALLAEIIKVHFRGHEVLLDTINRYRIEPAWFDIAPPAGRTVNQCRSTFDELRARPPAIPPRAEHRYEVSPYPISRQLAPLESTASSGRTIQPRPQQFNEPYPGPASPYTGYTPSPAEQAPSKKKRGRPSNRDLEERRQAAGRVAEPLPLPKPTRSPKSSRSSIITVLEAPIASAPTGPEHRPATTPPIAAPLATPRLKSPPSSRKRGREFDPTQEMSESQSEQTKRVAKETERIPSVTGETAPTRDPSPPSRESPPARESPPTRNPPTSTEPLLYVQSGSSPYLPGLLPPRTEPGHRSPVKSEADRR